MSKVPKDDHAGTSGPSGFDIRTLECPEYDHVHQMVVELVDPIKSTTRYFFGCLQLTVKPPVCPRPLDSLTTGERV